MWNVGINSAKLPFEQCIHDDESLNSGGEVRMGFEVWILKLSNTRHSNMARQNIPTFKTIEKNGEPSTDPFDLQWESWRTL